MDFEFIFVVVVGMVTAVLAFVAGARWHGLKTEALRQAGRDALECLGASVFFLGINLALGITLTFILRTAGWFFSLYAMLNTAVLVISTVEGCVFHLWWLRSHRR